MNFNFGVLEGVAFRLYYDNKSMIQLNIITANVLDIRYKNWSHVVGKNI